MTMKAKKMKTITVMTKSITAMGTTAVELAVIKKMMIILDQKRKKSRKMKKKVMSRVQKLQIGAYVTSLICEHCHQQSHAWMTHTSRWHSADNSYDVDKLEEQDKETGRHDTIVANDQQDAQADVDDEEVSSDSDDSDRPDLNSEEDDESLQIQSQVSQSNALALQACDSSVFFFSQPVISPHIFRTYAAL